MNQTFGPVNLSNSSLGSYSTSKASASSSGTRGEYRMVPIRKSSHESALNCCETTLHLYSVFRTVLLHTTFSVYLEADLPTTRCNRRKNKISGVHLGKWRYPVILQRPSGFGLIITGW